MKDAATTLLTPSFSVMSFNVQPPSRSHKAITDLTGGWLFRHRNIWQRPQIPPDKDNDSINGGFFLETKQPIFY